MLRIFTVMKRLFKKDCATWSDKKKIHLLFRKFGQSKQEKYANYILPRNPRELSFEATVFNSEKIFTEIAVLEPDKKVGRVTLLLLIISIESVKSSN